MTAWLKSQIKPFAIIGAIIGVIVLGFKIYNAGATAKDLECQKEKAKSVARAIEQTNQINAQNAEITDDYYKQKLAAKPKVQTIEKRIVKYVQKRAESNATGNCDLDDDELRIVNDMVHIVNGTSETEN